MVFGIDKNICNVQAEAEETVEGVKNSGACSTPRRFRDID